MKGTLLLLALLATGELGFQTTEACPFFYKVFFQVAYGNRLLLEAVLSKAGATGAETAALEKVQDCYNEAGLEAKLLDANLMKDLTFSRECMQFYPVDIKNKIKDSLLKFP